MKNKFFRAEKIEEHVTRIVGVGAEICYLIEGEKSALLIDGLTGIGSLKAFIRELTELPVTVALTHGHLDHTGIAWETDQCYIHPADIALMYSKEHSEKEARLSSVNYMSRFSGKLRTSIQAEDIISAKAVKTYPIYEGDVFDLGGITVEVIEVPGHTRGSIVFLDRKNRIVYSGDACNINTLLCGQGSTSVEEYLRSLLHFKEFQKEFDKMYGGHTERSYPSTIIDDGITLCNRILQGTDDAIEEETFGECSYRASRVREDFLPECGGFCNIVYSRKRCDTASRKILK